MNKLTEAEFLDFYSKAYGELTDKLGQTISHTFTGEELFEFVNDAIEYVSKRKECDVDFWDIVAKHENKKRIMNQESFYLKGLDVYSLQQPILPHVIRVPESPKIYDTPKVKTLKDKFDDVRIYVSSFFSK
jgi:hypothetical protein